MKIEVDKQAGFCWGVVRAIDFAEQELKKAEKLYSLGDIIHNAAEVKRLAAMGLSTISVADLNTIPSKFLLIAVILAVVFVVVTFQWLIEFSSFSVGLAKGIVGFVLLLVIDTFVFRGIDTVEEIKKGNLSVALLLLGECVIVGCAIIGS